MTSAAHHDRARVGKVCAATIKPAVLHRIEVHVPVGPGLNHDDALVNGRADRGPFGRIELNWSKVCVDSGVEKVIVLLDQHDIARL